MQAIKIKYASTASWCDVIRATKHKVPQPIMTFPAAQILGLPVERMAKDPISQAMGIKLMAEKYDTHMALGYMDLSAEAEAFGSKCIYSDEEVPTIVGSIVETEEDAENLVVPEVGAGRTGSYLEGIRMALRIVDDRPVFAECIGPFSLAGRLVDVNESMILCYEEPEMMHTVLEKATEFIIKYMKAYKELGAAGIMMAEPLAGILSPNLAREFSSDYVKRIVDEVQDKNFVIFYHNCGNNTVQQAADIYATGCKGYHFGDKVELEELLKLAPEDVLVMGNVSPSEEFFSGTRASVRKATLDLMHKCLKYDQFWLSSGCDLPAMTDPALIDAFFEAADDMYKCNTMYDILLEMKKSSPWVKDE